MKLMEIKLLNPVLLFTTLGEMPGVGTDLIMAVFLVVVGLLPEVESTEKHAHW